MDPNNYYQNSENNNKEAGQTPSYSVVEPQQSNYMNTPNAGYVPSQTAGAGRPTQKLGKKPGAVPALMLAGMLAFGAVAGGAGAEAAILLNGNGAAHVSGTATATTSGSTQAQLVAEAQQATINSIYQKLSPSVVRISSSVVQSGGNGFGGTTQGTATGTGIVLDEKGDILTNYHVIDGASSTKVEFSDGSSYSAQVLGTAQQDDMAVIKVSAPSSKLVPATLGDSSTVKVGDDVVAIGYPYGLDQSVTSGIVSGLNRDGSGSANGRTLTGLIQVDAAINPGNSGGPLVNAQGQVVGINTMIESPVEGFTGVGLSIPINHAKSLLSQLEQGGQVARPWLGISGAEIDSSMQQQYNLPVSAGILVIDVTSGGAAEQAGMQGSTLSGQDQTGQTQANQIGDIITAVDGHKVSAMADLTDYLNTKQPGDKISLTILRDGAQQKVTVTLQAWPSSSANPNN